MTKRIAFALAVAIAVTAAAQDPPVNEGNAPVFRTESRLVVCHTTVVDKDGHLITGLPQQAFTVYENKVKQQIRRFSSEDIPVSIGLVIDNSGSMRDKREKVAAAALALVRASNPADEVFVVNFNDEAYLDTPAEKGFTNDIGEMEKALARIDFRGGTRMRDAIKMSIQHLKKGRMDKKVLVVVTDGNDNDSSTSMDELIKTAQQSEVLIYSIGLLTDESWGEARKAKRALKALADATGGETWFPKDVDDVGAIARQVAKDLRSQYVIAYSPLNQAMDGSYRQIRITVRAKSSPVVRTRSGYYAAPDKPAPSPFSTTLVKP
jgi:VWFA-related protein